MKCKSEICLRVDVVLRLRQTVHHSTMNRELINNNTNKYENIG
jgi:hypothetical protein